MGIVMLTDFKFSGQSGTFLDAMYSILTHKGWFHAPKHMLAGMTTMGFRFTVHRRLSGESMSAYNWIAKHFLAADFIGMTSSQRAGFSFAATFPSYQRHAIQEIRESIDHGTGAIFWRDAFVVACGYDDEKEVLYYMGGSVDSGSTDGSDSISVQSLPYAAFGRNVSPYWYYQIYESRVDLDLIGMYKESLMQAISKWDAHEPLLPEEDYACGKQAYIALELLFRSGSFDIAEACNVIRGYAVYKSDLMLYTRAIRNVWPGMDMVAEAYAALSAVFDRMAEVCCSMAVAEHAREANEQAQCLAEMIAEARRIEENAIQTLRTMMRETIRNRFQDIALR